MPSSSGSINSEEHHLSFLDGLMKAPHLPKRRELLVQRQSFISHKTNLQQHHYGKTSNLAVTEPLSVSRLFETHSFYRTGRGGEEVRFVEETQYPLYNSLSGLQGRSRRVRKTSPPPGFDSQTAQPVGCRYTNPYVNITVRTENTLNLNNT